MNYLFLNLLQAVLYMALAPGFVGLIHWFHARWQARQGAGPLQPYRELIYRLKETPNIPATASCFFVAAPLFNFAAYLLLGFLFPLLYLENSDASIGSGGPDFFFVIYLFGLAGFVNALAAFDAGESFATMSSSRQFFVHTLTEPILFVAIYALAVGHGSSNIGRFLNASRQVAINDGFSSAVGVGLVFFSLTLVFLAKGGRLPFDNLETDKELTMVEAGSLLPYSGRLLALAEWGQAMRFTFFLSFLATVVFPWGMAREVTIPALAGGTAVYLIKIVLMIAALSLWETTQIKMRLTRFTNPLLIALGAALLAAVYATL